MAAELQEEEGGNNLSRDWRNGGGAFKSSMIFTITSTALLLSLLL